MKKKTTSCRTNKEALRWCKTNKAIIEFCDWKTFLGESNIPPGITCSVCYNLRSGKKLVAKRCVDKTLMSAVNKMIKDKIETDIKLKKS